MIRRAEMSDLPALIALEHECFTTDLISASSMRHLLRTNTAEVFIAEEKNTLFASAILLFRKNTKSARIYSLSVAASHRQKGIAKNLCETMEISALKRYSENIILEVHPENNTAIRFYEKQGYKVFGKYPQFYECGSDAIRMKKPL